MSKTRSSPVVPAKNKIIKSKHFSLGTAKVIFLPRTYMSTFKDARTLLLESYLDGVIDDDEFILQYTMKPSQFRREKVVSISNCPFINFEMNSFNLIQVFGDLFPFLSSRNYALFCSSEGINNHDFPARHFIVKRTPDHWLPKKIRIQFKRNL